MKYLLQNLRPYRKESILAPLFKMLEATFDLLVPLVVADIINTGIAAGDTGYVLRRCGVLVLLAIIGIVCSVTAQYFAAKASVSCASGLRRMLFEHIQKLDFSTLDTIGTGALITRETADIQQVQNGVNMALRLFLRSPFIVIGAIVMAFTVNVQMALIFLATIPVLSLIVFGVMKVTGPLYKKVQGMLDGVTGITRENLTGVRVVRAFHREEAEIERFEQDNGALAAAQSHVGRISALMNPLTYVVINLAIIAILQFGAGQIDRGAMFSGDVIALVNYMGQILIELVKLANMIVLLSRALASLHRISDVLDTKPGMSFPEKGETQPAGDEAVRFDHVSLRYAKAGDDSVSDLSFFVRRGETVGVIGGTGSGKTSLVNLIPRFYDCTAGEVQVLGHDVRTWDREALRSRVGVVQQKARLYTGTIRSNLLWGCPDATDEQLWAALETAQAASFVREKPLQLDEPVEQGGRNFSGGQRQRLSIARTLLMKPDILILDDSASALDFATDAALRKALAAMDGELTMFIVSQRAASIRHADRIIVLDDGHIIGMGTHDKLLADCEVYREIHESQFRKGGER